MLLYVGMKEFYLSLRKRNVFRVYLSWDMWSIKDMGEG